MISVFKESLGIIIRLRQNANPRLCRARKGAATNLLALTARVVSSSACASRCHAGGRKEKPLQRFEIAHFAEGNGCVRARRLWQAFSARKLTAGSGLLARNRDL